MPRARVVFPLVAVLAAIVSVTRASQTAPAPRPASWPQVIRPADQESPLPPQQVRVAGIADGVVRLQWDPPSGGPAPVGYLLEGGYEPGQVLGQVAFGAAPEGAVVLPPGVYFARLRSLTGDEASGPSDEMRFVVGSPEPPSAPTDLTALVTGSTLTLGWTSTFTGGAVETSWLLVEGTVSGALPLTGGDTATYANVPPGSYTLRVLSANAAGFSAPSTPVTVDVPNACTGAPDAVTDIRSWRTGDTLTLEWSAPRQGATATSYAVRVGGGASLSIETTARRLSGVAPPGHYTVEVVAKNACGAAPPAPAVVDGPTVVTTTGGTEVHFDPVAGASAYRIYWSTTRAELETLSAAVNAIDVTTSPAQLPAVDGAAPIYVRVASAHGTFSSVPSTVAVAPVFVMSQYAGWFANVTPALFDADGDGCLDLLGAWGQCDGTFERYDGAAEGFGSIVLAEGKARDVRWADFTGDGIVDAFTNVYTRADDLTVKAALFVGQGNRRFLEDPGVAALGIRGFGETILAADFDNDGDLDVFLPHYSHLDDGGHNSLLVNDGAGHFTDVAVAAGVAANPAFPPEGAQALDWNDDGWIDILVSSQLFLNDGDGTFTDIGPQIGLPVRFDEGLRLFDLDLDGDLDLVHHDANVTRLHRNVAGTFDEGEVVSGSVDQSTFGFGLDVCDLNGDGYEDLLVAQNQTVSTQGRPQTLVNVRGSFVSSDLVDSSDTYNDLLACMDLDGSGLPEIVNRWAEMIPPTPQTVVLGGMRVYRATGGAGPSVVVRVVDADGRWNQQGRTVRLRPRGRPSTTLRRMVDAGSAYMAQHGYDLRVATPWPGAYDLEVRFADGWISAVVQPGDVVTIHADGRVVPGLQ
jgi:hypothetical protein